jgi:tripartite ATP-independent transporter DctP family solute receptor
MIQNHFTRRHLLGATATVLAAPALIGRARAATTLKVSTSFPNDPKFSTARIWYDLFLPKLKAATDGQVATQFFPDNQLGQEADVVSQVKMGVVDMMLVGTSIWTNIVPECGVLDLGYIFKDFDHLRRASATPAAAALEKQLVAKGGAHFPAWGRNLGARNFMTKFSFSDPAGLAGKKIRSLPNPVVTETVQLMGAAATPMAFGEIYTGLQAGVIDGLEHDAPTILSAKFYETAKYFTLTEHIHTPFGAFISDRTLQKMPAAQRDGLLSAVKEATDEHYARAAAVEKDAIEQLKSLGVTVEECNRDVFRDRVRPMWDRFAAKTPGAKDLLEAVHQTETA